MSSFDAAFLFQNLPADSFLGRVQLLVLGMLFTMIVQASSVGVATTLTLLYTDAIGFEQAAALVVGMDVGTTFKSIIASIGASVDAKRTGYSHVFYNIFTGFGALFLSTPYVWMWETMMHEMISAHAEIALVAFHTLLNVIGVAVILPFTKQFSRMMHLIFPSPASSLIGTFDTILTTDTQSALNLAQKSLETSLGALLKHLLFILGDMREGHKGDLLEIRAAIEEAQKFIDRIEIAPENDASWHRLVALIHGINHLQRLYDRCVEDIDRAHFLRDSEDLAPIRASFTACSSKMGVFLRDKKYTAAAYESKLCERKLYRTIKAKEIRITALVADGEISMQQGTAALNATRWVKRSMHHIAAIFNDLERSVLSV